MARTTAKCMRCGIEMNVRMMVKSACNNRGNGKYAYLCQECAINNEDYESDRQNEEVGGVFDGFRFGLEFETIASTYFFRNMMCRFNFTPTHDCSLTDNDDRGEMYIAYGDSESSCEYVSDTNRGMKRFSKQFIEFEKCLNEGEVYMDETCGTHCHISYHNMAHGEMRKIREHFVTLFRPMEDVMTANRWETEEFFGRYFDDFGRRYAPHIDERNEKQDSHNARYCWINCTNDSNVEFRINRFKTAKQMRECIMFEKWVVKTIVNNYTLKYKSGEEAYNEMLAVKTAKKLAKKLQKIYNEM